MRMIPLAVSTEADGVKVRADDGVTKLPESIVKVLAETIARLSPSDPAPANDSVEITPKMKAHADEVLATVEGRLPMEFTGMKSLGGRTSYLSAVMQALFAIPEFRNTYGKSNNAAAMHQKGPENPSLSPVMQFCKFGYGLCSGRYLSMRGGIPPSSIKKLADLRLLLPAELTRLEQDPALSFEAIIKALKEEEPAFLRENWRCSNLFYFPVEERVEVDKNHEVAFKWKDSFVLRLPIPPMAESAEGSAAIPVNICLTGYMADIPLEHFKYPGTGEECTARVRRKLARFPSILAVSLDRLDRSGNMINDTPVDMPESLNVSALRSQGGAQQDELDRFLYDCPDVLVPERPNLKPGSWEYMEYYHIGKKMALQQANPSLVQELKDCGFREEDVRKAIIISQKLWERKNPDKPDGVVSAEEVILWLMENKQYLPLYFADTSEPEEQEEEDEEKELFISAVPQVTLTVSERQLVGMGFNLKHAKKALTRMGGNVERAVDWILNNMDMLLSEDERDLEAEREKRQKEHEERMRHRQELKLAQRIPQYPANNDSSQYEVFAVISHVSTPTSLNHFVLHVRAPDTPSSTPGESSPKWILCDGTNFSLAKTAPMTSACFYLYRKK